MPNRKSSVHVDPDGVLEASRFFSGPWLMLATTPALLFSAFLFWGGRNASTAPWFSLTVIAAAVLLALHGWEPWNMPWFDLLRGGPLAKEKYKPIHRVTAAFFRAPQNRGIQAGWVALGALVPWVLLGLSDLVGGRPIQSTAMPAPWWFMVVAGIVEALRGRAIALCVLARKLEANWPRLLNLATQEGTPAGQGEPC